MGLRNRFLTRSVGRHGVDYRRRARILLDTSLAILFFNAVVTLAFLFVLGKPQLAGATAVTLLAGSGVLPTLRWTGSVSIAGNILLGQIWALLHIVSLYTGPIQAAPPAWVVVLPLLAIHICDRVSSLVWAALASVEICTLAWFGSRSGDLQGGALFLFLAIHLGLLVLMVSTAFLNDNFKDSTLERLSTANRELSVARDLALEASRAKSTFVANMSHELRTPLNAVIGYSDLLAEDVGTVEPVQLKADLRRIKASGQHLLKLINELLEFSRLEAGRLSLVVEEFRVDGLIRELIQTMEQEAGKNDNTLSFNSPDEEVVACTDATRLRQCLYNLLSNACKFTHNGKVEVSLTCPPGRRRRLAEGLGGSLEGFSEEGKGSRFVLTVPDLAEPT